MGIVRLFRQIPDIHFTENENMSAKTSLGVGGNAKYYACPESAHAAIECIALAEKFKVPYKIVGNGTNLLVSDAGFQGLIVCTRNLNGVLLDKGEIIALCGTPLNKFVHFVSGAGRTGAEGLIGIPATVGGALAMNAGAFGYSVSDYLYEITSVVNGEIVRRKKDECGFNYRTSVFKASGEFIISAKFRFPKRKTAVKDDFCAKRWETQPSGRTCGSVFENPAGDFAGRLIESAGLKGAAVGGAQVSEKHANFIIAKDGAKARDVFSLIAKIKRTVFRKFGVRLKEEVEYLGEF
nr:UDP-N-acetylmuramate dehydrogenase [Clostridia bacterium]